MTNANAAHPLDAAINECERIIAELEAHGSTGRVVSDYERKHQSWNIGTRNAIEHNDSLRSARSLLSVLTEQRGY